MPRVLNKRTATPEELANAVYVGRPSKWSNPFKIGPDAAGNVWSREDVIALHRSWILQAIADGTCEPAELDELRGKDLVCWCAPAPCHADTLLEIANA